MTTLVDSWCYVFGIVPAHSRLAPPGSGLATGLRLVEAGDLAAVVSNPPTDRSLGRAADLLEHDRVLADIVAGGTPVLPMRFGAVLTDEEAVVHELLLEHADEFRDALETVGDRLQYTVKATWIEDVILREILAGHPDIEAMRRAGHGDADATFERRLGLGELIVRALEDLRPAQADALLEEIGEVADASVRQPAVPEEILHVALLVDRSQVTEFEQRIADLAKRHNARMQVRMVGPSPAYDFVGSG